MITVIGSLSSLIMRKSALSKKKFYFRVRKKACIKKKLKEFQKPSIMKGWIECLLRNGSGMSLWKSGDGKRNWMKAGIDA